MKVYDVIHNMTSFSWTSSILSFIHPSHAVVGIDHNELVDLAERHFNSLPTSPSSLPQLTPCR